MTSSARIGVGITTRNRHDALSVGLAHFAHFNQSNMRYVVVDDSSDTPYDDVISEFAPDLEITLRRSERRLGISSAKNACLVTLQDCDHVFLLDDDAWPKCANWAERWLAATESQDLGHSMYVSYLNEHDNLYRILDTKGEGSLAIDWWGNCMGLAMHYRRDCLDAIGGYDVTGSANVYGYEHAQMSQRASKAGFAGRSGGAYPSPAVVRDLIYSMDVTFHFHEELPPLGRVPDFPRTITEEELAGASLNSVMMQNYEVFIPLSDPI